MGKGLAPLFNRGSINSEDSGSYSPIKQWQEISLDGMSVKGPGLGPLIDDEFLVNVMGAIFIL